jgi:hypothetical protein
MENLKNLKEVVAYDNPELESSSPANAESIELFLRTPMEICTYVKEKAFKKGLFDQDEYDLATRNDMWPDVTLYSAYDKPITGWFFFATAFITELNNNKGKKMKNVSVYLLSTFFGSGSMTVFAQAEETPITEDRCRATGNYASNWTEAEAMALWSFKCGLIKEENVDDFLYMVKKLPSGERTIVPRVVARLPIVERIIMARLLRKI